MDGIGAGAQPLRGPGIGTKRSQARARAPEPGRARSYRTPSRLQTALLGVALAGLAAGGIAHAADAETLAQEIWAGVTVAVLVPTFLSSGRALLHRQTNVDVIAVLAMASALAFGQMLAGAVIAVMLSGGGALERFAAGRARRELTALLARAPQHAHRRSGADILTIDIAEVRAGDELLVKPGEVIPADGVLASPAAVVDEAALTGESRPLTLQLGDRVRSGGTNQGGPLELRVTASAQDSTYAGIIRLVRAAEQSKAPLVRLADRYALAFLVATLILSGAAWAISGEALRALSVLVVATPCPLLLAAPAAIIAGVSSAARHGIIVKGGGPLETLARVRVLLLDKTGTVTAARPRVQATELLGRVDADTMVRLAASVEQMSSHPYAPAVLQEARDRRQPLAFPTEVTEVPGLGISARADGHRVAVGQLQWVAPAASPSSEAIRSIELRAALEGSSVVYVAIDGRLEGAVVLQDPIRAEAPWALRALRGAGVRRIDLVTGDHPDVAELVGDAVGVDRVFAERTPEEKQDVVRQVRADGVTAMVGDGVNDAPALALADVGVAMGARGATAASEAASVVLTTDRLQGLVTATRVAQRTRRIALQSIWVGIGLSLIAMLLAAAGYIPPVRGAVLQEGIDVLVILNALRALGFRQLRPKPQPGGGALAEKLADAHQHLRPRVGELAALAARLETLTPGEAREGLVRAQRMIEQELLPHELDEQQAAFPVLGAMLRPEDPTGPLIQTHHEIQRLARLYGRLLAQLSPAGPGPQELRDLRRVLYGLHAVLTLHFAQEDELYSLLH